MQDWDGRGLPPVAVSRIERAKASGVKTSLLPVAGQFGIDSCGFTPVGEVMGCLVSHIGWQGYGGCGWNYGYGGYAPTTTQTRHSGGYFGLGPYLDAIQGGWDVALGRLVAEATALGADGVIGITFTEQHLGEGNREFVALGTAIRSLKATHLSRPFTTTLPGQDVAKLLHSGYAPTAAIIAVSVGIRHDDWQTRNASSAFAGNIEVPGYSELVHVVRADVRHELTRRVAATGATGAILTSPLSLGIHEIEVGENHRDHVGQASLVATGIVEFETATPPIPPPLMVLPLRDPTTRSARPQRSRYASPT